MKLSDAIEKGCKNRVQIRGDFFDSGNSGVCAMGAALLGIGVSEFDLDENLYPRHWSRSTCRFVTSLNDSSGASFGEIIRILRERGE